MEGAVNLTKGKILKQLFTLALPIIVTSFIQMAYSLTDMAWVGHLSSEAIAAVGACGIITWLSNSLSLLNKVASEVTVGQSVGVNDEIAAKDYATHNVMLSFVISVIWSLLIFVFAKQIIDWFKLEESITQHAITYLRIVATGMPFAFMTNAFIGIYNGSGNTRRPLYISGTGLVLNMILDPLLIYVFKLDTAGAAIATLISQIIVFILFYYHIWIKKTLLGGFNFFMRLKKTYVNKIVKVGLPVALLNIVFAIINMTLGRLASVEGGYIGLLTQTTGGQIEAITWYTAQGFSSALGAFVAQNYSAGENSRVLKAYKTTLATALIIGVLSTLLFVFWGKEVFSLFVPERNAYIAGGDYLKISGYSQIFMMLEITAQGMFYGIGRSLSPAIISIIFNCLRIPAAYLLVKVCHGVLGIWWAISLSSIFKGIVAVICLYILWKIIIKRQRIKNQI